MPQSELFSWMNCVIDPIDGRTHYTIDLIREIARCASITLPSPRVPNTPLVNIGTDVKARSAEYSNIHINIYERRDLEQERAELDALCEGLRKLLQQK
ncbi:hypothetical protein, partial [Kocuria sp. CNJ-770]|uniref:hypothetical protein n=1 Tax=Kocuria sp. CNJ-770 TaxID=1904964 RepID=UPI001C9E8B00